MLHASQARAVNRWRWVPSDDGGVLRVDGDSVTLDGPGGTLALRVNGPVTLVRLRPTFAHSLFMVVVMLSLGMPFALKGWSDGNRVLALASVGITVSAVVWLYVRQLRWQWIAITGAGEDGESTTHYFVHSSVLWSVTLGRRRTRLIFEQLSHA